MKEWKTKSSILLLVASLFVTAEAAELRGKVSDAEGKAIDYASIRIYTPDSVLITGSVCDVNGYYSVDNLAAATVLVSAGSIGFETAWARATLSAAHAAEVNFTLERRVNELAEVTVTAERFVRTPNGLTVIPDKEQTRHASSGYELIRNLMIPGVSVDAFSGSVSALGGAVALYIDGMEADEREVRQLRPSDVERVQFIDAPTGRYAGNNTALNFILKKQTSGGYVGADATQRIGYNAGDYNLAMKYYDRNTQYTLFAGADYKAVYGGEAERSEEIFFPGNTVGRHYTTLSSRERRNSQYGQLRVRNKNDRRTLRATLSLVRSASPDNSSLSALTYTGLGSGAVCMLSDRTESTRSVKYSLGLSGTFKIAGNRSIDASAGATLTDNRYGYLYGEDGMQVMSATDETLYNFNGNLSYVHTFSSGSSLTVKLTELLNVSSATYSGSHSSWQHLWMSESLLFAEYMQPLGKNASLRLSPGVSAQIYRLHGNNAVKNFAPRAQMVFAMQPAHAQYLQVVGAYGNSYPQLSMISGATTQVDVIQQRRGNPGLKQTHMWNVMAVYGLGVGKVNLQAMVLFNGATSLPMADYWFEDAVLVQSYSGNGRWRQWTPTLSLTWMPSNKFNMQLSGGWLYNGYRGVARLSASCPTAEGRVSWYVGDFAVNAYATAPKKVAGYDRTVVSLPWDFGLSGGWSKGSLRVEAGFHNPFYRRPRIESSLDTPQYRFYGSQWSPTDRQSAYVKAVWTFDFGKKTRHDDPNVDKSINSGILRAL